MEQRVGLLTIAREWGRIGCLGFGGPPAHILLLRRLCVEQRGWLTPAEFEDGIAATNLLPGPASTQLAILTAWRLRGVVGGLVGGLCFICPGLALILLMSALFLAAHPPVWVMGAAAGAGAAVPAVALQAAIAFAPSFLMVFLGGSHFDRLRADGRVQDFLTGAGPAVIGAIAGSTLPLASALHYSWQYAVLALALLWLLAAKRGVVSCLVAAGALGTLVALAGFPPA